MYKIFFKLEYNYFISLKKRIVQKRLIMIFCLFNMRTTLFGVCVAFALPLRVRACCTAALPLHCLKNMGRIIAAALYDERGCGSLHKVA